MGKNNLYTRYDLIVGSKRISNYFWVICNFLGGTGFFITGMSSYFKLQNSYLKTDMINFVPQGIIMTFYGFVGILVSLFLYFNILFDIGGGYNKYDKASQTIEIFRLGFPLKIQKLHLTYNFKDIRSIKLSIKDGLNPKHEIYLCTKDYRQIPLTRVGEPILLTLIEESAIDLASFLMVPLEEE